MSKIMSKQLEGVKADQLLSNDITAIVDPTASQDVTQGYFPSSVWVNTAAAPKKVFVCSDNSIGSAVWTQIAPSSQDQTVIQTLHGFTAGQVLKHSAGSYALAQADTQANVGIWLVTKVIDANTFQVTKDGYVTGLTGGTADEVWYLSDTTAGALTNVAPTIAQPIIYWITASEGWVLGYPATSAGPAPAGSAPNGYNNVGLTFTGATVSVSGDSVVQGASLSYNAASTVISGAAGWRYILSDNAGTITSETIPVAEIVADTQQYTPAPVLDPVYNGYYSSVNPTRRILGIGYFDGANVLEVISYGNGRNKNDNYWQFDGYGISSSTVGDRMQFTSSPTYSRGTDVTCTDLGAGNTDAAGFRITANTAGSLKFHGGISSSAASIFSISMNRNAAPFHPQFVGHESTGFGYATYVFEVRYSFEIPVSAGDYFTFYPALLSSGTSTAFKNIEITFEAQQ